jgi:hypothetical protein
MAIKLTTSAGAISQILAAIAGLSSEQPAKRLKILVDKQAEAMS